MPSTPLLSIDRPNDLGVAPVPNVCRRSRSSPAVNDHYVSISTLLSSKQSSRRDPARQFNTTLSEIVDRPTIKAGYNTAICRHDGRDAGRHILATSLRVD